jgi:hypothetical protein
MTLFWSLYPVSGIVVSRVCRSNIPFFESRYAFVQVTPRLELGILDLHNGNLGQCVRKEDTEVRGKIGKGVVAALQPYIVLASSNALKGSVSSYLKAVDEDQQQCLLHGAPELVSCILWIGLSERSNMKIVTRDMRRR